MTHTIFNLRALAKSSTQLMDVYNAARKTIEKCLISLQDETLLYKGAFYPLVAKLSNKNGSKALCLNLKDDAAYNDKAYALFQEKTGLTLRADLEKNQHLIPTAYLKKAYIGANFLNNNVLKENLSCLSISHHGISYPMIKKALSANGQITWFLALTSDRAVNKKIYRCFEDTFLLRPSAQYTAITGNAMYNYQRRYKAQLLVPMDETAHYLSATQLEKIYFTSALNIRTHLEKLRCQSVVYNNQSYPLVIVKGNYQYLALTGDKKVDTLIFNMFEEKTALITRNTAQHIIRVRQFSKSVKQLQKEYRASSQKIQAGFHKLSHTTITFNGVKYPVLLPLIDEKGIESLYLLQSDEAIFNRLIQKKFEKITGLKKLVEGLDYQPKSPKAMPLKQVWLAYRGVPLKNSEVIEKMKNTMFIFHNNTPYLVVINTLDCNKNPALYLALTGNGVIDEKIIAHFESCLSLRPSIHYTEIMAPFINQSLVPMGDVPEIKTFYTKPITDVSYYFKEKRSTILHLLTELQQSMIVYQGKKYPLVLELPYHHGEKVACLHLKKDVDFNARVFDEIRDKTGLTLPKHITINDILYPTTINEQYFLSTTQAAELYKQLRYTTVQVGGKEYALLEKIKSLDLYKLTQTADKNVNAAIKSAFEVQSGALDRAQCCPLEHQQEYITQSPYDEVKYLHLNATHKALLTTTISYQQQNHSIACYDVQENDVLIYLNETKDAALNKLILKTFVSIVNQPRRIQQATPLLNRSIPCKINQ